MSELERLAGFFAAEGSFGFYFTNGRDRKPGAHLQISQKERAPLEAFMQYFGVGSIHERRNGPHSFVPGSVRYTYTLFGKEAERIHKLLIGQPMTWSWFVGFWEGDGSVGFNGPYVYIRFWQKDRKVLDEIRDFFGAGSVHKDSRGYHQLNIYDGKKELTRRLLEVVQSPRRRAQLEEFAA